MSSISSQGLTQTIISGYKNLVREVAQLVDIQKVHPATGPDVALLQALDEDLLEQVTVTGVQSVKLASGVVSVVVTQDVESTTGFIESRGLLKHCIVRRARWGNAEIKEAGRLLAELSEADVIESGGGISATGDFAYVVTLAREVPDFSERLPALPEGLVTVSVQHFPKAHLSRPE